MDPELQKLRDALTAATKKASDAYAAFKQAKEEAESKGVDLLKDDKAFRPIQDLSRSWHEAKAEAEKARAEYMGALEAHVPGGGGGGGGTKDGAMPTAFSKAIEAQYGTKAFDVSAGGLSITSTAYDDVLRALPQRRLLVRSLIPTKTIDSDRFSYRRQTVATFNAAETAAGAVKPTSVISAERVEDRVRMIAHLSEPLDRALLRDLDGMRDFVDGQMRLGLLIREDSQIVSGNGTGENLRGILNTTGILTQAKGTDTQIDALFKGINKLRAQANPFEASGVVINPTDYETIRLAKASGSGDYLLGPPAAEDEDTLFGKPVVVTTAIAAGTALVGQFDQAEVMVRETVVVEWFASGGLGAAGAELASRNLLVVRAEEAVGFAVYRPAAFCSVTGLGA